MVVSDGPSVTRSVSDVAGTAVKGAGALVTARRRRGREAGPPAPPNVRGRETRSHMTAYFQAYGALAGLLALAAGFVAFAFGVNRLLRPNQPFADKLTTYESGVDPIGTHWSQTQIRYYVFAFLFVIFDVESVFLFPWAVVFADLGVAAFWEMVVFIGVLAVGLLYAYRKGVLRWA
jgi:NADH-quinone oxidoreductase subunit A